ncbi:MAG TPA: YciI family protein [Acidimicrobiales bacterium]|nr:YciI family protein [Acidimicrobiales bacterium]
MVSSSGTAATAPGRYRIEPSAPAVTLSAAASVGEGITCNVETGRQLARSGAPPSDRRGWERAVLRGHAPANAWAARELIAEKFSAGHVENWMSAPSHGECGQRGRRHTKENSMAKYLLLKHYRGAPAPVNDMPMDQWSPDEVEAHIQFMRDFATRLEGTGEFVDGQALSPEGVWVRYDGEGRPPVTDGPFAETKDLIAGWMVIDVDSHERAVELAGELSAAPGAGGAPIHEWLEVRPFLAVPPTVTE